MKDKPKRRANNHGCLIDKGPGRNYLMKWTGADGKVHTKSSGTSNYWAAMDLLESITAPLRPDPVQERLKLLKAQVEILEGRLSSEEVPLDKLWETYKSLRWESPIASGTARNYQGFIAHMTKGMSLRGCRNASDVTEELAEKYLQEISKSFVKVAYNNRLVLFKGVWKLLSERGRRVKADAWERFRKQTGCASESKRRSLTNEEVRRLFEGADSDTRLLIMLSYYTALRCGDCCLLKWENVDFETNTISVVPIKTRSKTGKLVKAHISPELREALLAQRETGGGVYVNERNAQDYRRRAVQARLSALFDKCGIRRHFHDKDGHLKILTGFHALRHTWASNAANMGKLSLLSIQQCMGWSSDQMAKVYVHSSDEAVSRAVDSMEALGTSA